LEFLDTFSHNIQKIIIFCLFVLKNGVDIEEFNGRFELLISKNIV